MKYLFRCLLFIVIIVVAVSAFQLIRFVHHKSKMATEINLWLIDYPIYGIRLGDNIKNIPNDYILTDYIEGTNLVFFKLPFEDVDEVSVMIDENHYIYSIGIEYNDSSLENFTKITGDFSKRFGAMDIEFDETDEDDIKARGTCLVDFDGKLFGVVARRVGKSILFPGGHVSIHYAHQDLLKHYMQKGKPNPTEELITVLNAFARTDSQEEATE